MDRTTMLNPAFEEQDDDKNNYVTKLHFFGAQRGMHQAQDAMNDRIEQLATDLRKSGMHTRDYLDDKLSSQMEEIRALMVTRASSTSTSRRRHSSRHSDEYSSDASPP